MVQFACSVFPLVLPDYHMWLLDYHMGLFQSSLTVSGRPGHEHEGESFGSRDRKVHTIYLLMFLILFNVLNLRFVLFNMMFYYVFLEIMLDTEFHLVPTPRSSAHCWRQNRIENVT